MSTTAPSPYSSRAFQFIIVALLFIGTIVLLYLFRASEQTNNALFYLYTAANGIGLFQPPAHLLYGAVLYVLHSGINSFLSFDAIWVAQMHGLVWAALATVSVYLIIQRLTASAVFGVLSATFLLTLNGFWIYSTQAETYIPMLAPLTLITALIVWRSDESSLSWGERLTVSALLFASMMFHQMGVLFIVPLSYYFLSSQGARGIKDLMVVLVISGTATLAAYLFVFILTQPGSITKDFYKWVLHYGYEFNELGTISHFSPANLIHFLNSQINSLVVLPQKLGFLRNLLAGSLLILLASALTWNSIQVVRKARHYHVRMFFLIWYATYSLFCIWWHPAVYKFLFPNLIPIIVLSTLLVFDVLIKTGNSSYSRKIVPLFLTVLFVSVASLNFANSFLPIHESKGPNYQQAVHLHGSGNSMCNIYVNSNVAFNLKYYFGVEQAEGVNRLFVRFSEDSSNNGNRLSSENCTLLNVSTISSVQYLKKSQQHGLNQPWSEFIKWILDTQVLDQSVTYNPYKLVQDDAGRYYVVIDRASRKESDKLESLLTQIEEDVKGIIGLEKTTLISQNERNKKLVFGY